VSRCPLPAWAESRIRAPPAPSAASRPLPRAAAAVKAAGEEERTEIGIVSPYPPPDFPSRSPRGALFFACGSAVLLAVVVLAWVAWWRYFTLPDAIRHGRPDHVRWALRLGADPNGRVRGADVTMLHLAVLETKPEAVELLLRAGADVNAENDAGDTPLDLAIVASAISEAIGIPVGEEWRLRECEEIIRMLKRAGGKRGSRFYSMPLKGSGTGTRKAPEEWYR